MDQQLCFMASAEHGILRMLYCYYQPSRAPRKVFPAAFPLESKSIIAKVGCLLLHPFDCILSPLVRVGEHRGSRAGMSVLHTMPMSQGWETSSAPLYADPFPLIAGGCAFRAHRHPRHISNKRCGTHRISSESSKNHLA